MLEGNTKTGQSSSPPTSKVFVTFEIEKAFLKKVESSFAILRVNVCREYHDESIDIFRMSVYAFLAKFDLRIVRHSKSKKYANKYAKMTFVEHQKSKTFKIFSYTNYISSHSLPGGNQVDGLPPATSKKGHAVERPTL